MKQIDLVIIGGGPAGMSAAVAAYESGVRNLLILERDAHLGGILQQCIHNGFGLHRFGEELTGPEYAWRYEKQVRELEIPYKLNTMVLDITPDKVVTATNSEEGIFQIQAKAVILAMGCRERAKGALNIAGTRPAGIYSAGTAQKFVNLKGYMPGKNVVILGSGDIGLIMARRMTLEGAKVHAVCELMPYSGGLARNIEQCLHDFDIPLKLSHTVVGIHGKERLEGVTIAKVDERRRPIPETSEYIACDTLLLSVGLIPASLKNACISVLVSMASPFSAYSRILVVMKSTPSASTRSASSGVFTVQQLTRRPAAWKRSTCSAVSPLCRTSTSMPSEISRSIHSSVSSLSIRITVIA